MTDRELMELAAKAAGIDTRRLPDAWPDRFDDDQWNPLIDDGDALRLAVKLNMQIIIDIDMQWTGVRWSARGGKYDALERFEYDAYAATRRAIVRAAAEIGKAMP